MSVNLRKSRCFEIFLEYVLFLIFIGIFVGVSAGLLGIGGGFFMVPLQYFLLTSMGIDSNLALRISIGTSLAVITPTALSGAYNHHQNLKNILKPGILLGIFGIIGGILGALTSSHLPSHILTIILGVSLVIVAINMFIDKDSSLTNRFDNLKLSIYTASFFGTLVGFSSGLLGIGGGIILIPILVFFLDFSMRESVGISLIFIALTAFGAAATYIITGWGINPIIYSLGYVNLVNFAVIAIFSIPTAYFSAKLVYKIPEKRLKQIFAIITLYLGIKLLGLDPLSYILGF